MIIGIDGNEANVEKRVGIGEYAYELLKQFEKIKTGDLVFKIYLKNKPLPHMPKQRRGFEYKIFGPGRFWTQFGLPFNLLLSRPRPDVFFTPSHYAPRFSFGIPTVISVMDLSYIFYPELFTKKDLYQLKNWTAYSIKDAKMVITISKSSKNDIIKQYKVSEAKLRVIYPGIKEENVFAEKNKMQNLKALENKYNISSPYLLFVGTLQPRKNLTRLIEAFSLFLKEKDKSPLQLVLIGKKGWLYEEIISAPEKFGIKEKVKFLDFVGNDDLKLFYENAEAFILPSLYEGFGLPVLEAMQNGCPVITSNISSLPEAGGEAALYFDPYDTDDIKNKIKLMIEDKKLRAQFIQKGFLQVKKFSWEKAAKETLQIIEEVVKAK